MIKQDAQVLPYSVSRVADRYLQLVDAALPSRVEGLYLVGSIALGDYKAGQSDIDFVAVTAKPLTTAEIARVGAVHQALLADIGAPWFDGIYVSWSDLENNPEAIGPVPSSHQGQFQRDGGFEANPVTWLILRGQALPLRGAMPQVWHDPDVLRQWNISNLNSYWAGMVSQLEAAAARRSAEKIREVVGWCVPGVSRLAYTIATGAVTSKSGSCNYALAVYPERWHPIIGNALAIRNGTLPHETLSSPHLRDTIQFMRYVINAVNARAVERERGSD